MKEKATSSRLLSEEEARVHEANGMRVLSFDIRQICINSLTQTLPPAFCWKSGGDVGIIPTGCPPGYFRFLALCYQNCKSGFYFSIGVCYTQCGSGYDNHPLSCYKNLFNFYFKKSYIPRSITNFSHSIPCPGDMYRQGALCYRNCETIGMYNCGIGACVAEESSCLKEIGNMIVKTIEGITTLVETIVTFGSSIPAKTAAKVGVKAAVKQLGKKGINIAKMALKSLFSGKFRRRFLQKAKNHLKVIIKDYLHLVKGNISIEEKEKSVENICIRVWDNMIEKTNTNQVGEVDNSLVDNLVGSLDVLGIQDMVNSCSDVSKDKGLGCGKSIVEGLSTFDPTGLMTISSAFMHPSCDVPETASPLDRILEEKDLPLLEAVKIEEEKKAMILRHIKTLLARKNRDLEKGNEQKLIDSVEDKCIEIFQKSDFKGMSFVACSRVWHFTGKYNDVIDSFIVGKNASGIFFEDKGYNGNHIPFTRGIVIKDLTYFNSNGVILKNMISSMYIGESILVSFHFSDGIDNFFFDDFKNGEINYQEIKKGIKIDGRGKSIRGEREFVLHQKALALSVSMYFQKRTVEVEFDNGTKKEFKNTFTLSIKDMPETDGKTIKIIRLK